MIGEFAIGLVDHQQHVAGQTIAKPDQIAAADARAGRVAGIGDKHDICIGPHGIQQAVDICPKPAGRSVEPCAAGQRGGTKERVGMAWGQRRAAGCQISPRDTVYQIKRPIPAQDECRVDVVYRANRLTQGRPVGIGVEMQVAGGFFSGLDRQRAGRAQAFVLRQRCQAFALRGGKIGKRIGIHYCNVGDGRYHASSPCGSNS